MSLLNRLKKIQASLYSISDYSRRLLVLCGVIVVSLLAIYYFFKVNQSAVSVSSPIVQTSGRDYYRSPFNMSDAYEQCLAESKGQLGEGLLRHSMDNISTHYKLKTNVYFIVLKVDVGSLDDYREGMVYCNVDAGLHEVTYYKEVYPGEDRSILSRTIDFFSKK